MNQKTHFPKKMKFVFEKVSGKHGEKVNFVDLRLSYRLLPIWVQRVQIYKFGFSRNLLYII